MKGYVVTAGYMGYVNGGYMSANQNNPAAYEWAWLNCCGNSCRNDCVR